MSRAKASGKRHGKKEMRKYAALPCRTVQRVFLRRRRGGKDLRNLVKNAEFHQDAFEERAHFSTKICPVRENVKLCLLLLYYQVVRREFFAHTFEPSITFNNYKVYVNTACLNKFPHADCAQLLINQESRILALRPCTESERDAFAWCNISGGKRKPRQVTGKFFFAKLFELMGWNIDYRYKLLGKVIHANGEYLIAFDLNASEIYQRIAKDGGKPKTARTPVFPAGWKDQFGLPYREHQKSLQINIFDGYAIYGIKDNTVSSMASRDNVTSDQAAYQPEVPVQEESVNG